MTGKITGTDKECGAIEDISACLIFPLIKKILEKAVLRRVKYGKTARH